MKLNLPLPKQEGLEICSQQIGVEVESKNLKFKLGWERRNQTTKRLVLEKSATWKMKEKFLTSKKKSSL